MSTVEGALNLPISFLKREGYFKEEFKYGGVVWSHLGERIADINFWVHKGDMYIRFIYTVKHSSSAEVQSMDYNVPFLRTSCYFGGYRYWFQCNYCQRRVGVLYINTYARCRTCARLSYKSQNASRLDRAMGSKGFLCDLDEERTSMRITHYAGSPTKRYKRYLKRRERSVAMYKSIMSRLA